MQFSFDLLAFIETEAILFVLDRSYAYFGELRHSEVRRERLMPDFCQLHTERSYRANFKDMVEHSLAEFLATASNSMRVKPPSSVLRSSSIRHENQGNTVLPFFLPATVATGPVPALLTSSALRTVIFSPRSRSTPGAGVTALESEPCPWRIEPRGACRTRT
jgi:hypothetical protein